MLVGAGCDDTERSVSFLRIFSLKELSEELGFIRAMMKRERPEYTTTGKRALQSEHLCVCVLLFFDND